ncbi:MAG TPA: hypothetical protein VJN18_24010 [Polyangiaceae bacterium]|nr:hypothetical protein [Polyangiaceae bacterium]
MKHRVRLFYGIAAVLGAAVACGAADREASDNAPSPGGSSGGTGNIIGPGGGDPSTQPNDPDPEVEVDRAFRVPVVSGRWVWTANPTSGRVALIDATNFEVKTTEAGAGPTYLAALPALQSGGSRALVINTLSEDATLLSANDSGEIEATLTLPVHHDANAWAISPDGRFAVAWTDASTAIRPDPSEGFQDITVLDLEAEPATSKRLSVGYRPARVFMDDDSRHAYVATDAGIDVVDLLSDEGAIVERELELSENPASDTAKRDVNMTPDGKLAFVSREGKDFITVVDVELGAFKDIALPGVVTDLDLSADASMAVVIIREPTLAADPSAAGAGIGGQVGPSAVAGSEGGGAVVENGGEGGLDDGAGGLGGEPGVASGGGGAAVGGAGPGPVLEQRSMAVLLQVASIFEAPDVFERVDIDELFGSVELGPQGATALLYSNGVPSTHLTLLGLELGDDFKQHRTVDLKLPVFSAVSAPDGAHAVVLLKPPAGSAMPGAFAVVPIAKDLPPKIQGTLAATVPADPAAQAPAMVAIDDTRAVVTVSNAAERAQVSYLVRMPELTVDAVPLASRPLEGASGIVREANQAFVAQHHPEGRITFIDLDSGEQHTLTGFELSTEVGQ